MDTITIDEAGTRLREVIEQLGPGQEVRITDGGRPVALLMRERPARKSPRQPGSAAGLITIVAEDDDHLDDFRDYMP